MVSELNRLIEGKAVELDSFQNKGLIEEAQYHAGIKKGLEIALLLPEKVYRENASALGFLPTVLKDALTYWRTR